MVARKTIVAASLTAALTIAGLCGGMQSARAEFSGSSPLSMVRSLQFVQDAIVRGDHSAIDMQRHLLGLIDERLRAADPETLADPDTIDAIFIYAMSGGNPATFSYIVDHLDTPVPERSDIAVAGDADAEDEASDEEDGVAVEEARPSMADLAGMVRAYLSGRGRSVAGDMLALLPHFKGHRLEPYLLLVVANSLAQSDPEQALQLFDRVRLLAPGTIIEESALRRSIIAAMDTGMIDTGMTHAERYSRRFLHSPYANQFADLLVELVIAHPQAMRAEKVAYILDFMDEDRRRSVYLRIARRATISGARDLAQEASAEAEALGEDNMKVRSLAGLYSGAAGVPTADIVEAADEIEGIDAATLSLRDRALRDAARSVADAVRRRPDASLQPVVAASASDVVVPADPAPQGQTLDGYVGDRRDLLDQIDALLEEDR